MTSSDIAIKVESLESSYPMLKDEHQTYLRINNSGFFDLLLLFLLLLLLLLLEYFPHILWMGVYNNYNVMVMDRLGLSLDQFAHQHKRPLDNTMISTIGEQMLTAIEIIHDKSLLHR